MNTEKMAILPLIALGCYLMATGAAVRVKRADAWKITTIVDDPYTIKKADNPTKNEDFDGFIPDLLKSIGKKLEQSYTIMVVADGKYGAKDGEKWSGMIGEVVQGKADIAAAAITVSDSRKEVVSFTDPWMQIKSVIVMKKPADGSESKIKSAQDLAAQSEVKYGAVKEGTTLQLIRNSSERHFVKINEELNKRSDQLVSTSEEGIRRVRDSDGNFAFITESATGDYWAKRKCDLVVVEIALPAKEYAFAVTKNSPIKGHLDTAIKSLKDSGDLDKIIKNWWKDECSGGVRFHLESLLVPLALVLLVAMMSSN